jgi:hemolysin III
MHHMSRRTQSAREELANALSHGVGTLLALVGAPVLIAGAARTGSSTAIAAAAVFAATLVLLYLASTLYHAARSPRAKEFLRRLDHGAIYLLIAGTYTPFTLGPLAGPWGWALFGTVWGLAALGVTLKLFDRLRHPHLSTGLYLAMGWCVLPALGPLIEGVPGPGLWLLVAGGLSYTAGTAFFALDAAVRYAHFVWHLFVLGGSACHFFAVLGYAV